MAAADLSDHSLSQLVDLTDRVAVVTGGARGLGKAIARRLGEAGASVYVTDLDGDEASSAASELGDGFMAAQLDVTDRDAVFALAERARDQQGRLDIWINNAGIYPFSGFTKMSPEEWKQVISVNLDGVFHGAQAAAKTMVEQDQGGVIVNIASTAGYGAEGGGIAHYCSTKHAVRGFTKSLAVELGGKGVRALAVAPTLIDTPGTRAKKDELAANMPGDADPFDAFAQRLPLGRVGVPDDVARVVLFCCSDLAAFMTGDTLLIDGGLRSN